MTGKKKGKVSKADHTERAYKGIRQMLFYNEIMPGQKIAYRDLAERLSMSPTPVIQALKWLEFQGLVRREPNRGYYTEPISLKEVEEIYNLRELLEPALLQKSLQSADPQGLQRFQAALEAHNSALQEKYLNKRLLTDMEFHLALASLSGCQTHHQILRHLFDLLYLKYRGDILFFTLMRTVGSEHQAVYDAVMARDLKLAQETLTGHIRNVKQHVLAGLQRGLEEKQDSGF